jgi:hypothetical protein
MKALQGLKWSNRHEFLPQPVQYQARLRRLVSSHQAMLLLHSGGSTLQDRIPPKGQIPAKAEGARVREAGARHGRLDLDVDVAPRHILGSAIYHCCVRRNKGEVLEKEDRGTPHQLEDPPRVPGRVDRRQTPLTRLCRFYYRLALDGDAYWPDRGHIGIRGQNLRLQQWPALAHDFPFEHIPSNTEMASIGSRFSF